MAIGDDMLQQMHALVFDPHEDIAEQQAKLRQLNARAESLERAERARQRAIVRGALATPAGAAFLAWLRQRTIELPASADMIEATSAEAYALRAARREGANQLYFTILEAMADEDEAQEGEA